MKNGMNQNKFVPTFLFVMKIIIGKRSTSVILMG